MWKIGNFNLENVSRPRPPIFNSQGQIFTASPASRNWGYRSRIILHIYEHVPANNVYSVVKFYANPRLQKHNFFFQWGPIRTACPKSGSYAHPFGSKFDGKADKVETIMWTIGNFHLEIVSRPWPSIFNSHGLIYPESPASRNWGNRSRIILQIYEHVPANNVYTVVKFYANPRQQKRNCFLTMGSDPDRLPQIRLLRSSVWYEIWRASR
jgi:hypothetical protein